MTICPHCGISLTADQPIERDGWVLDPRGAAMFHNQAVTRRPMWVAILHTLAAEDGRQVTTDALLNRASYGERPNIMATAICQLRRHLRAINVPDPVGSSGRGNGGGYFWVGRA